MSSIVEHVLILYPILHDGNLKNIQLENLIVGSVKKT